METNCIMKKRFVSINKFPHLNWSLFFLFQLPNFIRLVYASRLLKKLLYDEERTENWACKSNLNKTQGNKRIWLNDEKKVPWMRRLSMEDDNKFLVLTGLLLRRKKLKPSDEEGEMKSSNNLFCSVPLTGAKYNMHEQLRPKVSRHLLLSSCFIRNAQQFILNSHVWHTPFLRFNFLGSDVLFIMSWSPMNWFTKCHFFKTDVV